MLDLKSVTPASFSEHLQTRFRVHYGGDAPLELELYEVSPYEKHPGPRTEPFSAYFHGPREAVLPQRIYRVEHDRLGEMELFLVPIGPDEKGMRYEVVFN